jgi:hypothetical protein
MVCSTPESYSFFQQEVKNGRTHVDMAYRPFEEVEDFLVLSREIKKDDLIIMVNARKGTISYHSYMDSIPAKLILSLSPIQEQIDNLAKIGKAVKKIFKGGARE